MSERSVVSMDNQNVLFTRKEAELREDLERVDRAIIAETAAKKRAVKKHNDAIAELEGERETILADLEKGQLSLTDADEAREADEDLSEVGETDNDAYSDEGEDEPEEDDDDDDL